MAEYKVGDRVVRTDAGAHSVKPGALGTVEFLFSDGSLSVQWATEKSRSYHHRTSNLIAPAPPDPPRSEPPTNERRYVLKSRYRGEYLDGSMSSWSPHQRAAKRFSIGEAKDERAGSGWTKKDVAIVPLRRKPTAVEALRELERRFVSWVWANLAGRRSGGDPERLVSQMIAEIERGEWPKKGQKP